MEGVVGFLVTLLFEVRFFTRLMKNAGKSSLSISSGDTEDVDVASERCRVEQLRMHEREEDLIVVDNITKVYMKKMVSCKKSKRQLSRWYYAALM